MKRAILFAAVFCAGLACRAQAIEPSATYLFARRDTCSLYLDVYDPAEGSQTTLDGKAKPTILFIFGGGFIGGHRDSPSYLPWFRKYTEDGYRVVSIDYRLGLKGKGNVGLRDIPVFHNAVEAGVEDAYSATVFLIDNASALGIDPSGIVLSGSSAGAIISLQAEWHLCNRTALAQVLPEDFRYAGVMSFAGAVFSREGKARFDREPAPVLFLHGTDDKVVPYRQIWFFRNRFAGSRVLCRSFIKKGWNYNIYRFDGRRHEIASAFNETYAEQIRFLETNVIRGQKRIVDATVDDPDIFRSTLTRKGLYDKN